MKRLITMAFLFALAFTFTGCKSIKHIEQVPVYIHDTTQTIKVQHDSIHIDHFREVTKLIGDTILVHDSVSVVKYLLRTDTAYKYVEKPVVITKTETIEVAKRLPWWKDTLMRIGAFALIIGIGYLVVKYTRKRK